MNEEVQLFATKLLAHNLVDRVSLLKMRRICGDEVDLLDFGEKVLEHISDDFDAIQNLLDETVDAYDAGERAPKDPFKPSLSKPSADGAPAVFHADVHKPEKLLTRPPFGGRHETEATDSADQTEPTSAESNPTSVDSNPASADPTSDSAEPKAEPVKRASIALPKRSSRTPVDPAPGSDPVPFGDKAASASSPTLSGDYGDMDLSELAQLAVESVQKGQSVTPKARAGQPSSVSGPVTVKIEVGGAGEAPNVGEDRAVKPAEAVIQVSGARPIMPDFARLASADDTAIIAAMLGLMMQLQDAGFSDLHLCADGRPYGRRNGVIEYLAETPLPANAAHRMAMCLLSEQQQAYFSKFKDYDFAMALDDGRRYRVNLMQHKDGTKITLRMVPTAIQSLEQLGFGKHTETMEKLLAYHNGLILVTGPVGSGKTTTLASMVDYLNRTRTDHIITVEDPIEIVHRSQGCSVTQRGVGPHTKTFRSSLKGALRQDPDIIIIGEMRDLETIEMAISASETGHLVIGTMHTSDAAMTLNRLLDVFPPAQQPQIRAMVAESLRGVICQRLLPAVDGSVALACELLIKNTAVGSLIKEGKQQGLSNIMETGKRDGMIQMDSAVLDLFREGRIDVHTARENIRNEMLRRGLEGNGQAASVASDNASGAASRKKKGLFG